MAETSLSTSKSHEFATLLGVGVPLREFLAVGIASVGKLCPDSAQEIGPALILVDGLLRQLVAIVMKHVEAVL